MGYHEELAGLMELAGSPKPLAVHAEMRRAAPRGADVPSDRTVAGWMTKGHIPRREAHLQCFVAALHHLAQARRPHPAPRFRTWPQWRKLADDARSEADRGARERRSAAPPARSRQGWRTAVEACAAWQLLSPGADPGGLKERSGELADVLEDLYEEACRTLGPEPWRDDALARRISARTNRIVHLLWKDGEGFLSPAEAALTALLPFLHQTHRARTAADLSAVGPTDLGHRLDPDRDRRMYERLLRGHERLVRRAELGGLDDGRDDGRPLIGWWLFHQWARRQPGRLGDLLAVLAERAPTPPDDLMVVLDPDLLPRLLHCAHAGPAELFDPARAEHLREDPYSLDFHGRDFQDVRERLVGPLFAVAHALAIEVTGLNSVVVRHVGIPEGLDPATLRTTVADAGWRPRRDGIGLKATCDHPAAVAALKEHAQSVEALLRAVRRLGVPEFDRLPAYTWADEVREVDASGAAVPVDGLIRFRLDEERVQELLMGENLYRDRSLAVRELYQNALDACRYRRSRLRAADPGSVFPGRIEFTQGYDEEERRHYLECRDNGVGMDELTLSEVFSQAGIRFTDLSRYQEESDEWESSGVRLYPNSRFGIGVLSYFMLADEVRVTTCHMDPVQGRLRELTVLITGPGHYFRVRPTGRPGRIGTTVRLYLREGEKAPSCVRELRRFLGVAEFETTARHEGPPVTWEPGVLRPREPLGPQHNGFEAHGRAVAWAAGPRGEDGQVFWVEHGGGILIDGIHAEPRVRRGVLAGPAASPRLRGAVVNLTGASCPRKMSVDRAEVLDEDLHIVVERLLQEALPALLAADPPLLTHDWLRGVSDDSLRLADMITEAAGAAGYELTVGDRRTCMAVAGFFPHDHDLLTGILPSWVDNRSDDATLLWRLLAHRPHPTLAALAELVPELHEVTEVLPALPSDQYARTVFRGDWRDRLWPVEPHATAPGHAALLARMSGRPYAEVVARVERLSLQAPQSSDSGCDDIDIALVTDRSATPPVLETDEVVPPGHLLKARFDLGVSITEAAQRLTAFGFRVPPLHAAWSEADDLALRLMSQNLDGEPPWIGIEEPVGAHHVYRAHARLRIGVSDIVRHLTGWGFHVEAADALTDDPDDATLRLFAQVGTRRRFGSPGMRLPAGTVLEIAVGTGREPAQVARVLRAHGYDVAVTALHERLPLRLLTDEEEFGVEQREWAGLGESEDIPPGVLAQVSVRRGVSPREAARDFAKLGFRPPATLPERAESFDALLLSADLDGYSPWLAHGETVSARRGVLSSLITGLPPAAVTARLHAYGMAPQDIPVPAGPTLDGDHQLRMFFREPDGHLHELLLAGKQLPRHVLVSLAASLHLEPAVVARWLAAQGLQAPAGPPAQPNPALRSVRRVLNNLEGSSLTLRNAIVNFCAMAEEAELPAPDLITYLEDLDVDLDLVREAVRAALPRVPGLVMKEGGAAR